MTARSLATIGILLSCTFIIVIGCEKSPQGPVDIRIVAVATPIPTPAPNFKIVYGVAFIDLKGRDGVNVLHGIKTSLVDGTDFQARFERTKAVVVSRYLAGLIFSLEKKNEELFVLAQDYSGRLAAKQDEYSRFNSIKWANFTYVDIDGRHYPNSSWFDSKTRGLMTSNMNRLQALVNQWNQQINNNENQIQNYFRQMIANNKEFGSIADCQEFYVKLKKGILSISRSSSPEEFQKIQHHMNIGDILTDIDQCTVDNDFTDEEGKFAFKVTEAKNYLVFAYHGDVENIDGIRIPKGFMWLLEAKRDGEEYRRLILSDSNSFDRQNWDHALRPEIVSSSFQAWLESLQ